MEYAITVSIVLAFALIYILTLKKVRPVYFEDYGDGEFSDCLDAYIKKMPLPKEQSKISAKKYVSTIKRINFMINRKKYNGFFESFVELSDRIKPILKFDFSPLENLPSIDGEPRAVKLIRFCLAHSDYKFVENRVIETIEAQNVRKTLSFSEISSMNTAFIYVLLEKICYIYLQLETLAKVYNLAAKYVYNPVMLQEKYKKLTKSKLFLSLCSLNAGYKTEYFSAIHKEKTDGILSELSAILSTVDTVRAYDFSRYYTPLEILDKFEVFSSASNDEKKNFLTLVQKDSDKENLDEFLYVIRLEKYMQSASAGHLSVNKLDFLGRRLCVINQKSNLSMLGAALSSHSLMTLFFADKVKNKAKKNKSIMNLIDFENTFEPIYKFHNINFGISTKGGRLRISPSLPADIKSADIAFDYMGTENNLHIVRSDEPQLLLGNTKLEGIEQIKLGSRPLDITVGIPLNDAGHKH